MKNNFLKKPNNNLNIFFTAGFPYLNATIDILESLQNNNCDMVEIGMPFSDPLADGAIIQESSQIAIKNGMNIDILFKQLSQIKHKISIPIILMGYLNPVLQYGFEKFLKQCKNLGIKGTILPDLPLDIYENEYKSIYDKYNINNIFLITPETESERIKKIDSLSNYFIYVVSSSSTTGKKLDLKKQDKFFQKIKSLKLKNPYLIGFGIKNKIDFDFVCKYSNGAIIGSSFIKQISNLNDKNIRAEIDNYFKLF